MICIYAGRLWCLKLVGSCAGVKTTPAQAKLIILLDPYFSLCRGKRLPLHRPCTGCTNRVFFCRETWKVVFVFGCLEKSYNCDMLGQLKGLLMADFTSYHIITVNGVSSTPTAVELTPIPSTGRVERIQAYVTRHRDDDHHDRRTRQIYVKNSLAVRLHLSQAI